MRTAVTRKLGLLWIVLGWGFATLDQATLPGGWEPLDPIRPGLWIGTGALALVGARYSVPTRVALLLMIALIAERMVILGVLWLSGTRPTAWFTVLTYIVMMFAPVVTLRLPPHDARRESRS